MPIYTGFRLNLHVTHFAYRVETGISICIYRGVYIYPVLFLIF
jgi:hypothetical protein